VLRFDLNQNLTESQYIGRGLLSVSTRRCGTNALLMLCSGYSTRCWLIACQKVRIEILSFIASAHFPPVYFNFKQHQISPSAYLPDWLVPLFLDHLPFEACARLWDVLLLEGDSFLFRAALAVLAVLEPRLFFPDRQELLDLLG